MAAMSDFRPKGVNDLSSTHHQSTMDLEKRHLSQSPPETSEKSPPSLPTASDEITYPEGGLQAWLVVLGAFCGTASSIGLYNSSGLFEAYMSSTLLPEQSTSNVGWIFGVYAFITWFLGVQIGPTFDAMGPTGLMVAGSVCTLGGIFALSASTEYYQVILSFSLLTGLGTSLLVSPANAVVAHWFHRRRGLASGIAWVGSGLGGVIFPLLLQSLLPRIGWSWALRVLGLLLFVLCLTSVLLCKSRVPPRHGTKPSWRDTLPSTRVFRDGTGAMAVTTAGVVLTDVAYYIPVTYIPSYYIARQHLPASSSLTGDAAFAYQLLAISNASSCVGRLLAGFIADSLGRYNTMTLSLVLCAVSVLGLWLPDILLPGTPNTGLLIVFVLLFGCVSGSNVSLLPVCLGQLCETREYGRYYASCYTVVAFGMLGSAPVAGALLDAVGGEGKYRFWGVAVFTGMCYVVAAGCFAWVRWRVKGVGLRVRW